MATNQRQEFGRGWSGGLWILEVLRTSRTGGEHHNSDEETVEQAEHPADSCAENPQVNDHDRVNGTDRAQPGTCERSQASVRAA